MIEDTSGNRREWYDEPVPGEPKELRLYKGISVRFMSSRQASKTQALSQAEKAMKDVGDLVNQSIESLFKPMKKSDYTLFPPGQEMESIKDRALRLQQQPHSMAQDPSDFHFDHRGRRHY